MPTTRTEDVAVGDGTLPARLALPAAGHGPALVLVHEIFGVNDYVTDVADRLAALGYVVICPDLFWRIAPGAALPHDDDGLSRAMELALRLDLDRAVADCVVTLEHARSLPEVTGGAGLAGFCLGGSLAYLAAAETGPDLVVAYYGSSIPEHIDLLDRIGCPVLLHFGGLDRYIPREQVALVEKAAAGHAGVDVHVQEEAGHAFDNHRAATFHRPDAAAEAWRVTSTFLRRHLPLRPVGGWRRAPGAR